jgi:putative ABC transport system permease protein
MRAPLHLHRPTIVGRLREDAGLLLLTGLVVALTTAVTAAVGPVTDRAADRAIAASVRDAGSRGAVVATFPREDEDRRGQTREPGAVVELRQDTDYAQFTMPAELAAVVRPGIASLTTPPLQLLDAGPGRYLRLTYLDPSAGSPEVTYVAGGPPEASVGEDDARVKVPAGADPWPVQVAISEEVATALGLGVGDQLSAKDQQARPVDIRIAGVYTATDPDDEAWTATPQLLHPVRGTAPGTAWGAALVSEESLPDLRLAVPLDDLTQRVVFGPRPSELTWHGSAGLVRAIESLKTSPGIARGKISWDSLLDGVLDDSRAQVATARGQADVLLLGMLTSSLLVLLLAAQLLAGRRSGSVALARARGATLGGIAGELFVEAFAVATVGACVGLGATRLLAGGVSWGWLLPVLAVACLGGPALGVVTARRTDSRRVPANRSARRIAARARLAQRYVVELAVVAVAILSFVALRQRGVTDDLTAAGAPTWWALVGALVVVRVLPLLAALLLRRSRASTGGVRFFALARLAQSGVHVLTSLVIAVAVLHLTFGLALAATEHQGQAAGALLSVGGDARLSTAPDAAVEEIAAEVTSAPGVEAVAAGRVEDGVRASSRQSATAVRLVVVDAAAYERLLAKSALPDAPDLGRLAEPRGDRVPALLVGGDAGLRDRLVVSWDDDVVPLEVVGTAPRVDASVDPVVVVDAGSFLAAGAVAEPNTVWAVGPEAPSALRTAAGPTGSIEGYADVLTARRDAPLASGLVDLAVGGSVLLLLFAMLGVVLSAAAEAPARAESLGRLRSLGLSSGELRRALVAELLAPVVLTVLTGLACGVVAVSAMFGSLGLEQVTGQSTAPDLVLPWWPLLAGLALGATVFVVAQVEAGRLRRTSLAGLLRARDRD